MDPIDLRELRRQLEFLSGRLSAIEARLGMGAHPSPPEPPPVLKGAATPPSVHVAEPVPSVPVTRPLPPHPRELWPTPVRPPAPAKSIVPPKPAIDLEYLLGAKALPWAAALLLLIGIGTLVSLGFSRGWITPWMLWWGGVTLSAAFIGVGQWNREEKEQFGQILTGIGSCALYLTFAAGHVAQHLYSGETLVLQFVTLSLINLGYALWRGSMAFLIIGLIGGFSGALMPLQEGKAELNVGLHMLILTASVVIAARQKWWSILCVLGASSLVLLFPMLDLRGHQELKIGAVYADALVVILGLSRRIETLEWDEHDLFAPLVALAAAGLAFALVYDERGALHVAVWAALVAGAGFLAANKTVGLRLRQTGLVLATALAPFGFSLATACGIESSLAVLACGCIVIRRDPLGQWLALLLNGLAIGAYLTRIQGSVPLRWDQEVALLSMLGAATVANLIARWRLAGRNDEVILGAAVVMLPIFVRAWERVLTQSGVGADLLFAIASGLVMFSFVLTASIRRLKGSALEVLNWFVVAGFCYFYAAFADETPKLGVEAILAGACLLAALAFSVSSSLLERPETRVGFQFASTGLVGAFAARILFRVLSEGTYLVPQLPSAILAIAAIGIICSVIGRRETRIGIGYASFAYLFAATAIDLNWVLQFTFHPRPLETELNLLLEAWAIGVFWWGTKATPNAKAMFVLGGWTLWLLFPRLCVIYLARAPIGIPDFAAFALGTLALIPFALILSRRGGLAGLRYSALAWLTLAGWNYAIAALAGHFQVWAELPINLAMGGLLYWLAAEYSKSTADRSNVWTAACLAGWALSSRCGLVALTSHAIGMEVNPAVSITWTLYAVALLTIGFMRQLGPVRLFGLFVFAATATKVIAVDLDNVEPALRVVVSMALGFAMLGVGYWYIRRSRGTPREA